MIEFDREFHRTVGNAWKWLFTLVSVSVFLTGIGMGVREDSPWQVHLIYIFSHANIFHLLGNILCLWQLRPRLHMPEAILIAVAVTWLPLMTGGEATMGMSGVLFAVCGIKWGQKHRLLGMIKYCGVIVAVTALIPGMSWAVHAYTLMAGFLYGWVLGFRHDDLSR